MTQSAASATGLKTSSANSEDGADAGAWEAWPWGLVIIGGPILLGGVLAWVKLKSARTPDRDPGTPSDDPSKGMVGHD